FIASRFERLGLKRITSSASYLHRFNLTTATLGASSSLTVTFGNAKLRAQSGVEFVPLPFSPAGEQEVEGRLVFVGFGIRAPHSGHDDYRNLDVHRAIVLALDHEPGENDPKSPFDGVVMSEAATPLQKALIAQDKGAAGILLVSDLHNHPEPENFEATAQ